MTTDQLTTLQIHSKSILENGAGSLSEFQSASFNAWRERDWKFRAKKRAGAPRANTVRVESMVPATIEMVEKNFEEFPILKAPSPGTQKDILELEAYTGFSLPDDYKEFILKYGAGVVGPYPVYGIGKAEVMAEDEISAFNMTRVFREDQWDGTEDWLVFSMDHAGNPVGIDRYGVVWISDHDFGGVTKLFDTFEEYLRHTCLKVE